MPTRGAAVAISYQVATWLMQALASLAYLLPNVRVIMCVIF